MWPASPVPRWFIVDNFFQESIAFDQRRFQAPEKNIYWVQAGEYSKSWHEVEALLKWMTHSGIGKGDSIAVIGGGTVLDLGLFAAALFQRGTPAWCLPTTLLAAVDAGIGGKNGVNFLGLKNYIGTITQPQFIITDANVLHSLSRIDILNGWMEMAKHALIAEAELWKKMQGFLRIPSISEMDTLIQAAITVKTTITKSDERETGRRKALNFGHTVAHALESRAAHLQRNLPHGIAVGLGMMWALQWSARLTRDSELAAKFRGAALLIASWLESDAGDIVAQTRADFNAEATWAFMLKDKKNAAQQVLDVILEDIGMAAWNRPLTFDVFQSCWIAAFAHDIRG